MNGASEKDLPFLRRLWIYQSERFPLIQTIPLLAAFSASSVTVSAALAERDLPSLSIYITAFLCVFVVFFQMRAMDEVKDFETDRLHRPERAVPRGLVSLRNIVLLAAAACVPAFVASYLVTPTLVLFVAAVWLWLALMTKEFFVPRFLHASPALYLISHMAIMPLIDLFLTACEWLPRGGSAPIGIWTFLWMSFCNGCVIEFGRKIWAPQNERPGVETYSSSWGLRPSLAALALALLGGLFGLVTCGFYLQQTWLVGTVGGIAALACAGVVVSFLKSPNTSTQKRLETASGLWVLICYLTPAIAPFAARMFS